MKGGNLYHEAFRDSAIQEREGFQEGGRGSFEQNSEQRCDTLLAFDPMHSKRRER